ncbi:MAG: DNA methyltransferase, partial [Humidesulfovibrio sp.]|nr:DNA methyltransferase [Humidesulfovibrio sp.]
MNALHYGDNLDVLRGFAPESVDLVYLDPPFNSNANYNVLFKSPQGQQSQAQIEAFEDTWHWGEQAEGEYRELLHQPNTDVAQMIEALRRFLGENDMMAYLVMMANRLLKLHTVLKPTGSLYLHCDPTASHYLKMVLDGVFGKENYRNEVVWKRTSAHSAAKRWGDVHDVIFFYSKTNSYVWNNVLISHSEEYTARYSKSHDGRLWADDNLTAPGVRHGASGAEWKGLNPTTKGLHWKISNKAVESIVGPDQSNTLSTIDKLELLDEHGFIHWPKSRSGEISFPRFKRFLSEGVLIQDVIVDVFPINSRAQERLGYPTQKPLALLERIIQASSNPGDVVLDPFCGCGTALHAAHKLGRAWIGIDITHLAISLIEKRLRDAFPGLGFETHGTPKDLAGAQDLARRDKFQFEWWACSLVNAQPYGGKKKGADSGIDGLIFFQDGSGADQKIIVSVKGGDKVQVPMIRDLGHVVEREKAAIGLFVTLAKPTEPMRKEAVKTGYFECERANRGFPKIQILTIEGLLNGTERP